MSNPKVSVIVPIYRAENYLNNCVDSILGQTLRDMEIILVDDGSPDKSGEIADQYAELDSRVVVVHQQNKGLGPARNAGMEIATGEYVGFVDSDDWVREDMFRCLYEEAILKNVDIVVSGHCDVAGERVLVVKIHPLAGTTVTEKSEIMNLRKNLYGVAIDAESVEAFPMSVCMSIYKRSMIEEHSLRFQKTMCEDTIFNIMAYACAESMSFLPDVNYCYRKEDQPSITLGFTEVKRNQYRDFLQRLTKMAGEEADDECCVRVKRMAIDTCRMFVGIVGNAKIPLREKIAHIRTFAQDPEISGCWEGYPVKQLPMQQRVFHRMLQRRWYLGTLVLQWIRGVLKKGKQNGIWHLTKV